MMANHAILRARQRLGIELTRGMLVQMADAVRMKRTRYLGSMVDGKQQHMILVDGREVYFVFDPARSRVCTITDGPADSFAARLRRKSELTARRAAGRHGTRNGRSFRTDPLSRFAIRASA
jgi:hypothetical protein